MSFSLILIPLLFFCYYYAIIEWDNFPPNNWSQIINMSLRASLVAEMVKNLPEMWEAWVWFLVLGRSLGKGNDYPLSYSFLENPWTEKPARLQSTGSQRVGHDWAISILLSLSLWEEVGTDQRPGVLEGATGDTEVSSVQSLSCVWLFATPWIAARQTSLSITNSWSSLKLIPSSWWCHPAISSSVIPFSSCPQSLPGSGSFPMTQLFACGGQSIGVSASASVLPMNIQAWYPLGWTGWISLKSKGLSRVFSNTTVQKHQFFGTQLSSQSNSHIHTWPLEKP